MAEVDVKLTGPLFDGRAERAITAAVREAEDAVAQRAVNEVRAAVGRRAKNPSGRFASRVVTDRRSGGRVRVHASGLRYTAWLEGTSRRNAKSTFKGYQLFRNAREDLRGRAPGIAGGVIGQRVKELG